MPDSGDRVCILWSGGVTPGIYADHRDGGRVIVDDEGPIIMKRSEFGRHALRGGVGEEWGTPLDRAWERLHAAGEVDDTTSGPGEPTMFRCPHCGQLSPVRMACGGSFTDRDHPSSVLMVPVETEKPPAHNTSGGKDE